MDISSLDVATVIGITVICYLVGMAAKAYKKIDNAWIPVIVGIVGMILGIVGMFIMPDFPANDVISAAGVGIVSGLTSTGVNQVYKQLKSLSYKE